MAELWILLVGLAIGSFLNVCIYRVPRKISVTKPLRSFCPSCNRQLSSWENIPVLSWIVLRAKCRTCRAPISERYPFIEILSGCAAVLSYLYFGLSPTALVVYVLTATLIVIAFIDLDFKIIPNVISLPGIIVGLCLGIVSEFTALFTVPITSGAIDSLIGMLLGGGVFYSIGLVYYWLTKKVGLGGGDIKLLGMTGAILGWRSILPTILAGSVMGAVVGISGIIFRGGSRHSEIPYGPWLALGAFLYMFGLFPS